MVAMTQCLVGVITKELLDKVCFAFPYFKDTLLKTNSVIHRRALVSLEDYSIKITGGDSNE
jgi:hypothetical protein